LRGSGLAEAFLPCLVGDGGVGEGAFSGGLVSFWAEERELGGNVRDFLEVSAL
jgi:hypothetical protein